MEISTPWSQCSLVAFDTETSGAWPVGCDVVEFGAVKWRAGAEVERLQILIKPREPMSDFIIGIHGITNEMVAQSLPMAQVIGSIAAFIGDAVLLAHHAPFDMGFLAADFETYGVPFPSGPVLCTSLLARRLVHGCENHKLQTLVRFLGIPAGAAHRALDDARACLQVGLHCFNQLGAEAPISRFVEAQGKTLRWEAFSLAGGGPAVHTVAAAVRGRKTLRFLYDRGPQPRTAVPLGVVRNPDGDFMQAVCQRDGNGKRFYLAKMRDLEVIPS